MKRLLLIVAFVLLPAALFAQTSTDRDILLTPDGTLYTIDSIASDNAQSGDVNRSLRLTVQQGSKSSTTEIPESINTGINWRPALAYDIDSKTLFVFWLRMPNSFSSELLLATIQNGKWQPAVSIDNQQYHLRYNLRIGITRHVSTIQTDGTYADSAALLVHAVWWEQNSSGDAARYALMTIDKGSVTSFEIHDLSEFASQPDKPFDVGTDFNPEVLKHPAIIEGTDSVDVVFGDLNTRSLNRVTLKPVADGKIHIPIGHHGGTPFGPPQAFAADWNNRISLITSPVDDTKMAFYTSTKDGVSYVTLSNGAWSNVKTIATGSAVTADGAVNALSRLVNSKQ